MVSSDISKIHDVSIKTSVLETNLSNLSDTVKEMSKEMSSTLPLLHDVNSQLKAMSSKIDDDEARRINYERTAVEIVAQCKEVSVMQIRHDEIIKDHSSEIKVHEKEINSIAEVLKDQKKLGKLAKSTIIAALALGAGWFGYDEMRDRNAAIERELKEYETAQQNQRLKDKRNHLRLLKKEGNIDVIG